MVSIYHNIEGNENCTNYTGIELMSHTTKLWDRMIEHILRFIQRHQITSLGLC